MKQNRPTSGMDPSRRRWLQALTAAPVLAGAAAGPAPARAAVKTSARIVIAGSGLGGIAVANRLSRMLDGAKITIIDRKEEHNYQPGYTLVATGVWPVEKVRDRNADYQPAGVEWVKDMVAGASALAEFAHSIARHYPVQIALHTDHCPKDKLPGFMEPLIAVSLERVAAGVGGGVRLGPGEAKLVGAAGVGAQAGGIGLVADVADEEVLLGVAQVHAHVKVPEVSHARAQAPSHEDDAGVLAEGDGGGRGGRGLRICRGGRNERQRRGGEKTGDKYRLHAGSLHCLRPQRAQS